MQIRKISVKRIVNPIMFDNSRAPVEGGLCDPALGPMDFRERYATVVISVWAVVIKVAHISRDANDNYV